MLNTKYRYCDQKGFSLIEILIGLVIGLVVSLVVMQTFSVFEGQKRTTSGVADTQTNGSIALYNIARDVQMAGFGLPLLDLNNSPIKCSPAPTIDHDNNGATAPIGLFPIVIKDGAAGASDEILVRYASTFTPPDPADRRKSIIAGVATDFPTGAGISTKLKDYVASSDGVRVNNNRGCQQGDVILISNQTTCTLAKVTSTNVELDDTYLVASRIKLSTTLTSDYAPNITGPSVSCLGRWNEVTYRVNPAGAFLEKNGLTDDTINNGVPNAINFLPNVADIVNIQAQYGVSDIADANQVTHWVNATGIWTWTSLASSFADETRIKAVRIAVVARSGLLEKTNVTNTCTTAQGTVNNGPCAWDDTVGAAGGVPAGDAAPRIDLSNDPNWQRYRYRVFETIIPIRNIAWNRSNL